MYKFNYILDSVLLGTIFYYLWLSPYSKVEESFNIQAIHDVANYGLNLSKYDHKEFPGPVPRTFIGSLFFGSLTGLIKTALDLIGYRSGDQQYLQFCARGLLGLANFAGFVHLRNTINAITFRDRKSKIKGLIGFWFNLLLISQFHLLYYSTRTLPNFIALPLVNFSLAKILKGDYTGLTWLAFTATIFRLEIGFLAVIIALVSSQVFGQSNIFINFVMLTVGTVIGLILTGTVDSYFWGYFVIPELYAFKFNVIDGKASEWGVQPFQEYFMKFLPSLFRPPVVLILAASGFVSDPAYDGIPFFNAIKETGDNKKLIAHPARHSLRILFVSSIIYILGMSFQPHKEWRFIIYTAPIFILQAANSLADISIKSINSWLSRILLFIVVVLQASSVPLSIIQGYASSFNYAGGEALAAVNNNILSSKETSALIHLGVASCMTGASRFGQLQMPGIIYDKTENEEVLYGFWNDVNYLIAQPNLQDVHSPQKIVPFISEHWELIYTSKLFAGISTKPIINLLMGSKGTSLQGFSIQVLHELINEFQSPTLINFLRSLVLTKDFINVWKRVEVDELPERKNIKPNIQQILTGVEETTLEEVAEDLNEEIDELEEEFIKDHA